MASPEVTVNQTTRGPAPRLAALGRVGLALGLFAVVLLLVAGPGTHLGLWTFQTGFLLLRWGAYAGLAAAAVSLLAVLTRAWRPAPVRWWPPLAGVVLGLTAAAIPWWQLQSARAAPPIHDVTTDMDDPPAFVALRPARMASRNGVAYGGPSVAARQQAAYPDIRPLRLEVPPARALEVAESAARALGWRIAAVEPPSGRLEATDRTTWFGFRDDVVVRITAEGTGSRLDVRSASRVGAGDAGANARRVRSFLARVQARVGRPPAPQPSR